MQVIIKDAFERHGAVWGKSLEEIGPAVEAGARLLLAAAQAGQTVFTCGNGGSAADALHLAGEFTGRYKKDRRPLAAIALGANLSHLTATANDYSYEDVFSREIKALGREGEVLVAFTTHGGSKNVLKALTAARAKQMRTIVLTGTKGKYLTAQADIVVAVPSEETARIQEIHELVYHIWCEFIDANLDS